MKSHGRPVGAIVLCWAFGVILASCASTPQKSPQTKEEAWPEATRTDWENKEDPCKGKGGEPVSCTNDEDCCKGFTCTLDPERSRVSRYCIEG